MANYWVYHFLKPACGFLENQPKVRMHVRTGKLTALG